MREPARERLLLEPSERREVGLHRAHHPHRRPVAADLVERSDETGDGGHRGRRRAVARLPVRDELHPAGCLLPDAELDDLPPTRQLMDVVALVDAVLGIADDVGPVLHEPSCAGLPTGLLVGGREQDQVAVERLAATFDGDHRHQIDCADPLAVERAAWPTERRTRWDRPFLSPLSPRGRGVGGEGVATSSLAGLLRADQCVRYDGWA